MGQKEIYSNPKLLGKILIIKDGKIIHVLDNYEEMMLHKNRDCSIFKVPKNFTSVKILTFRIMSLTKK